MYCIYCGDEISEKEKESGSYKERHGPGLCCSPCQYCRWGVPHPPYVCGDRTPENLQRVRAQWVDAYPEYR